MKISDKQEIIICPKCNGNGKFIHSERITWNEDEYWEEKCDYCNGKIVVERRTLVEDFEVEEVKTDTNKHVY